jgi:hypothetical protein
VISKCPLETSKDNNAIESKPPETETKIESPFARDEKEKISFSNLSKIGSILIFSD